MPPAPTPAELLRLADDGGPASDLPPDPTHGYPALPAEADEPTVVDATPLPLAFALTPDVRDYLRGVADDLIDGVDRSDACGALWEGMTLGERATTNALVEAVFGRVL